MSDPDALRLAGWHLALLISPAPESWQMCDGTSVDLHHIPDLMESSAYALQRVRDLRAADLVSIADLRERLDAAESERDAGARGLVTSLARTDALSRQLADERAVHHRTASEGQVEMLHAELSVAPRLALVRAGDAMALDHTPETVAAWNATRDRAVGEPTQTAPERDRGLTWIALLQEIDGKTVQSMTDAERNAFVRDVNRRFSLHETERVDTWEMGLVHELRSAGFDGRNANDPGEVS